jgi:hypothetical protein
MNSLIENNYPASLSELLESLVLFASGYEEGLPVNFDETEEDVIIIEKTALKSALVSALSALFPAPLRTPAIIAEYFFNSRLMGEMIYRMTARRNIKMDKNLFLKTLAGLDIEHKIYPAKPEDYLVYRELALLLSG